MTVSAASLLCSNFLLVYPDLPTALGPLPVPSLGQEACALLERGPLGS